ncbi:MAG: PfkB family carbohydrate kinase [Candidatus Lightella neohaematopini]|nr:PfkB family carbohydrate kinase [Candidatus Lightella neohaematopini]MCV2529038.1 PfkB family carbohydrate kinase [Candidatus Lightella neohaematopini]
MLKKIISNFSNINILVVGDIILDRYYYGINIGNASESPTPIIKINNIIEKPGGAANVAINIANLKGNVNIISLSGRDDAARYIRNKLISNNIKYELININNYSTTIKSRIISNYNQIMRLDFENENSYFQSPLIIEKIKLILPNVNMLVLSDYNKGTLSSVQEIIKLARNLSIPIIVDPKGNNYDKYNGANILTPNIYEFQKVIGTTCYNNNDIVSYGLSIIEKYNLSALLITRDKHGISLIQPNNDPLHIAATQNNNIYSVVGAGDVIVSILALLLSSNIDIKDSCILSNKAAGLLVSKNNYFNIELKDFISLI